MVPAGPAVGCVLRTTAPQPAGAQGAPYRNDATESAGTMIKADKVIRLCEASLYEAFKSMEEFGKIRREVILYVIRKDLPVDDVFLHSSSD